MEIIYNEDSTNAATERVKNLLVEMNGMKQNRSNFALTHFVVMQHDRVGRQRMQVLDELESMLFSVLDMQDNLELNLLDLKVLQDCPVSDPRRTDIAIRKAERDIIRLKMQINSHTREIQTLLSILDRLPVYTREQFEAEEAEYWNARLSRQALLSQRGNYTGMGEGNLDTILQMLVTPGEIRQITDAENVLAASLPAQSITMREAYRK
jgi:hypothetical protein